MVKSAQICGSPVQLQLQGTREKRYPQVFSDARLHDKRSRQWYAHWQGLMPARVSPPMAQNQVQLYFGHLSQARLVRARAPKQAVHYIVAPSALHGHDAIPPAACMYEQNRSLGG